jgi:hypothetical protein
LADKIKKCNYILIILFEQYIVHSTLHIAKVYASLKGHLKIEGCQNFLKFRIGGRSRLLVQTSKNDGIPIFLNALIFLTAVYVLDCLDFRRAFFLSRWVLDVFEVYWPGSEPQAGKLQKHRYPLDFL